MGFTNGTRRVITAENGILEYVMNEERRTRL